MRNTSHSSTAADLLQARQQLTSYQQQVEELNAELIKHHDRSREQLQNIEQLQNKLGQAEMVSRLRVFTDRMYSSIFGFCVYNNWCLLVFVVGKKSRRIFYTKS